MSERVIILLGDPDARAGVWKGGTRDGARTASLSCPECGRVASLSDHTIDAAGNVSPSVVCPYQGCTWHVFVKLEGWEVDDE